MIIRKGQLSRINCLGWPKSRFCSKKTEETAAKKQTKSDSFQTRSDYGHVSFSYWVHP